MLQAIGVRAGELLAAAVIAGGICLAIAVAAVWWLKRRIRRRLETIGLAVAQRAIGAAAGAAGAGWLRLRSRSGVRVSR
jgi:hypothetical protein